MNRKLAFYGAISVDGYLARENDALDWLIGTEGEEDVEYKAFYDTVDTILMGRKTYDQICILSPENFPYTGKDCYVFSKSTTGSNEDVTFFNGDIVEFTRSLKNIDGNTIWIVGGGEVLKPLLEAKLIDEFIIQIAPTILGKGLPMFLPGDVENKLTLLDVRRYKQFAELHYELRK